MDAKSVTVTEVSKRTHKSRQNIHQILNGKIRLTTDFLEEISLILGVPPGYFFNDQNYNPKDIDKSSEANDADGEQYGKYLADEDPGMADRATKVMINEIKELNRKVWDLEQTLEDKDNVVAELFDLIESETINRAEIKRLIRKYKESKNDQSDK